MAILEQAANGIPVPALHRGHGMSSALLYKWCSKAITGERMNKTHAGKKNRQIPIEIRLLNKVHILPFLKRYGLRKYKICNYSIGNDEQIHILLAKTITERKQRIFAPAESNTEYAAISFIIDWQNGGILHHEVSTFGILKPDLHFIQRLKNGFLLVGSRTRHAPNAFVIDTEGKIVTAFNCGDGIEQCLVDRQNRIITSYFDEGVFGGSIGTHGVVTWSPQGELLWKNQEYTIYDCYAVNLDSRDNLWFYYFREFNLVRTNYEIDTVFHPGISGSNGFLLYHNDTMLLFDAGYNRQGEFIAKTICEEKATLSRGNPAMFMWNGERIVPEKFSFRASKALLWDAANCLYYTQWRNDTMV